MSDSTSILHWPAGLRQFNHTVAFHFLSRQGVYVLISLVASYLAFNGHDFHVLYTAALYARNGMNPYAIHMFVSPLDVLVYFIPVSFLPEVVTFRLTAFLSTFTYCYVLHRATRYHWIVTLLALTTPMLLYNIFAVNIDWMLTLAALVNPLAGFWLALLKPQIGSVLALLLIMEIRRRYGWRVATLCIAVQATIYLFSFTLYNTAFPLDSALAATLHHAGNMSIFPGGLLLGISLIIIALHRRSPFIALASGPLISPYVGPQSWSAILPWLARHCVLLVIIWIASWLFVMR